MTTIFDMIVFVGSPKLLRFSGWVHMYVTENRKVEVTMAKSGVGVGLSCAWSI